MRLLFAELPPVSDSVGQARALVRASLIDVLSEASLDAVQLMVSELVTNGVRHAALSRDDLIELTADLDGAKNVLQVEVRHAGTGFAVAPRDAASAMDAGWGLYIVDQIADAWGVRGDGVTTVWFTVPADRNGGI